MPENTGGWCFAVGTRNEMPGPARALDTVADGMEQESELLGFDEAFTLHHRSVYRAAYSLLRDSGLAEDVTQEVFLRLHRSGESRPPDEILRPWLLRVAINLSHNAVRTRTRAAAREEEFVRQQGYEGSKGGPDQEYERRVEREEAHRALERIREPMRSCMLLKNQGFSYREIAEAVTVNEVNVGSLIARGRKEFMRLYGKTGGRL